MNNIAVGIPWYRPEDFESLRRLFIDRDVLHDTYDEWLTSARRIEKDLKDSGAFTVRAYIDPRTFPAWCLAKGMLPDEKARSTFASEAAYQAYSRSIDSAVENLK